MRTAVDLHIHSCLSPCADEDMTPCNIAAMAALKGLGAIAVTDHNSGGNAAAAAAAGAARGLLVVPGVEVTTREEIHALCYFPAQDALADFIGWLEGGRSRLKNRPDTFGRQLYMSAGDRVTGEEPLYLPAATEFALETVEAEALARGGVLVPAHIDRPSFSLLASLGMIPAALRARTFEAAGDPPAGLSDYRYLRSSDAHTLGAILEPTFFLDLRELSAAAVVEALREPMSVRSVPGCTSCDLGN